MIRGAYECLIVTLQDILKHTARAGEDTSDLEAAVEVMCVVPKEANDMMNVGRLQGFPEKQLVSEMSGLLLGIVVIMLFGH